jgi:hypothetical protein
MQTKASDELNNILPGQFQFETYCITWTNHSNGQLSNVMRRIPSSDPKIVPQSHMVNLRFLDMKIAYCLSSLS